MAEQMKFGDISPFAQHRSVLLDYYGAARILRTATASMWTSGVPFSLAKLGYLDEDHLEIFKELLAHYLTYGENDDAFMRVGRECKERWDKENMPDEPDDEE